MKLLKRIGYVLLVASITSHYTHPKIGIANGVTGGRFGDNLLAYGHARWLAFVHNWDFYYSEFDYSDKLAMHKIHKHRFADHNKKKVIYIEDTKQIPSDDTIDDDTLFVTVGFPRNNRINYDNSEFVALMREEIKALSPVTKVVVPKEMLAVAVHVRRGGGWDRPLIQEDTLVTGEAWGVIIGI